ncbi:MAG: tetratricopeptide repeat protein [candidate division Zixibacteria bacterium]|nr:tetratricopeptide repeat protein [candidate division Zixibacteria bacterium]
MGKCTDKYYSDMLHLYELGMLSEENHQKFEIHLIDCENCYNKVEQFKNVAKHIRKYKDVREVVKEIAENEESEPISSKADKKQIFGNKIWRSLIPTSIITAVILVFLILKPWKIDFQPSGEAVASENRIAIMYFANLSDPSDSLKFGEIAANLLMTDLAESDYLNIVSSQRLYDLLKLIGQEGIKTINKETASIVANKANADCILMGNILQTEPNIVITIQLIDAASGDIFSSQKITGDSNEDIFSLVDRLTIKTKENLNLPSNALIEPDPQIASFTTNSPDAYRHYLKGLENVNRMYNNEAIADFKSAIQYDSTFAMAYYHLAKIKDGDLIDEALKYSDSVSTINKLFIKIAVASYNKNIDNQKELLNELIILYPEEKEGFFQLALLEYALGNFEISILHLNSAIKIDPNLKLAYNQLAYTYNDIGNFEKALWAIDKYIDLAPGEANPLDSKADIYARNGMLDNAIESYKRALTIKPDFIPSLRNLCMMYIFNGQYNKADSCMEILQGTDRDKAYIPLYQGKLNESLKKYDITTDSSDKDDAIYHFYKSRIYIEQKKWVLALAEIDKAVEMYRISYPNNKAVYRYLGIQTLAESGDLIKAKKQLAELKAYVEESGNMNYTYWFAKGAIDIAEKNYNKACSSFEKSRDHNPEFCVIYMLARAYFWAGRYDKAIEEFEKIKTEYSGQRSYFPVMSVKLYYYLGLTYEQTGQFDKAIEQYNIFLDIWRDADDGLDSIQDAKERSAKQENRS